MHGLFSHLQRPPTALLVIIISFDTSARPDISVYQRKLEQGGPILANHLTPTELAREAGMDRREVIDKCMEMGVPIFQGRIDKTLFLASLKQIQTDPSAAHAAKA
jgi:hypothetical protein